MKKITKLISLFVMSVFALSFFFSCQFPAEEKKIEVISENKESDIVITRQESPYGYIYYSLMYYANREIKVDFSADMKVNNKGDEPVTLMWQIDTKEYPVIASYTFEPRITDFKTVTGQTENTVRINSNNSIYLSTYNTKPEELEIEIKNVAYQITSYIPESQANLKNWIDTSVPSLYQTYKDQFDYVGIACEYSSWLTKELSNDKVCSGLKKHANSITMGNEFKPDSLLNAKLNSNNLTTVNFEASNGLTISVPDTLNFDTVDNCLAQCKKHGLKMRGHVLVWHSQTPDNFFADDYHAQLNTDKTISNIVSKDVMSARQEWYIKTVLNHVAEWEAENNNSEHIIWAWDVVNEAVADDADSKNWLRGSTTNTKGNSRWYQIYENEDFIVDAFRYANAYAPSDIKLCYNDYNEYMGYKTTAICNLIDKIQRGELKTVDGRLVKPRINAMGMQSHVRFDWPGISSYESAIKTYLNKGIDIHVTELDIAANDNAIQNSNSTAACYGDYFKLFQKYGNKSGDRNKIECVTLWGINNKSSWIYKGNTKYPLLFDDYNVTPSFTAVIQAHQ